jgi:ABC-type lipoprotein export system ATPase subunit
MGTFKLNNIRVNQKIKGIFNKQENYNILVIKNPIEINSGDIIFVSGENGSGKSVFLNLISRNIGDVYKNYRNLVIETMNEPNTACHFIASNKKDILEVNSIPLKYDSEKIHNHYKSKIVHFESDNKENNFYFLSTIKKQFLVNFKERALSQASEKEISEKINKYIFGGGLDNPNESYLYKMAKVIYRNQDIGKNKEYLKQVEKKLIWTLSSGQKQMFAFFESLARVEVLEKEIEVVIFDEPLNYLDGNNRDIVIQEINRLTTSDRFKHLIIIIVSHCTLFDFLKPASPQYQRLKRIQISKQGEVHMINKDDPNNYQCGRCHQRRK